MADPYAYPSPTTQLEQLAGAAHQASSDAPNYSPDRPPNPRKRKSDGSSFSSRGVANLTPEQLAKKRANDREAQRAIRERTRNNIEMLERRIHELESQQPFQELQAVIRSRDAVIAENEELKRRLANICALAQPQPSTSHGLNDLALATSQQSPLPMPSQSMSPNHNQQNQAPPDSSQHTPQSYAASTPFSQQHLHPDLRATQSPQPAPTAQMHPSMLSDPPQKIETGFEQGENHKTSAAQPEPYPIGTPLHARIPLHSPATCLLDSIFFNTWADQRKALDHGERPEDVIGPVRPTFHAFIAPPHKSKTTRLSSIMVDVMSKFPNLNDIPTSIACYFHVFTIHRWLSDPSESAFENLRDYAKPTRAQYDTPHPVWFDYMPWPAIRERMCANPDAYHWNTFFVPLTDTVNVNWPHGADTCMINKRTGDYVPACYFQNTADDSSEQEYDLSPDFEQHCRDINNWTLGTKFAKAFPELADLVRIVQKDDESSSQSSRSQSR